MKDVNVNKRILDLLMKYYETLTSTQRTIAEKIATKPSIVLENQTLLELSNALFVSTTTIFNFIKKVGFTNFYQFKNYIESETTDVSRNGNDNLVNLISQIDQNQTVKKLANEIQSSELIVIFSKGHARGIVESFSRKLLKLGKVVLEVKGSEIDHLYLLPKKRKTIYLGVSYSGNFAKTSHPTLLRYIEENIENFWLISSDIPNDTQRWKTKNFLYALDLPSFSKIEFDFPLDSEIVMLELLNRVLKEFL